MILVTTEQLEPPAIDTGETVFKPSAAFALDDTDPSAGQAVGLFVTIALENHRAAKIRLIDSQSQGRIDLVRVVSPASDAQRSLADLPRPFNDAVLDQLKAGTGVFWPVSTGGGDSGLEARFGLLIPQALLSPFTHLVVYASTGADGTPIRAAELQLVRDFFYLVVLGDSVQWGNGLEERDKMSTLTAAAIEQQTQRKVILQRYAQSGARILPAPGDGVCPVGCWGEVPRISTSITVQADQVQRPDLVNLVLMDGCINDVSVPTLIDPQTDDALLATLTQHFCRDEMTILLRKVRALMPQAAVVVTGYFQIVGPNSDILALRTWSTANGVTPAEESVQLLADLTTQSDIFYQTSAASLRAAVDDVNAESAAAPTIAYADAGFGPDNAIFTPNKWLWSMTSTSQLLASIDLGLQLFPEDPLQNARLDMCLAPEYLGSAVSCAYVSVGHPNPTGARAYTDAILRSLRTLGVLPRDAASQ